jgi:enhancing lycopene biosynthesis protein 2
MLKESARIARGKIKNLVDVNPANYAALIIPGGNGTAANLCNFASAGKDMVVQKDVARLLRSFHESGRPIGAICISPMLIASVFGKSGVKITLGDTEGGAPEAAAQMGAKTHQCGAKECVVDHELKIVTTPAYMLDASIADIAQGIRQLTKDVLKLAKSS